MLKDCPIGKGDFGAIKAPVALFSTPMPSGTASVTTPTSDTGAV